jgi:hypothetical protein
VEVSSGSVAVALLSDGVFAGGIVDEEAVVVVVAAAADLLDVVDAGAVPSDSAATSFCMANQRKEAEKEKN